MDQSAEDLPFCIVILSGPSGSGKTTIVSQLIQESPVKLIKSISATTRAPREHETDGDDYYFLSAEEFEAKRNQNEFLECAEVHRTGSWYGTLRSEVERARNARGWCFLEIDVEGALNVMQDYPEALSIFVTTPSEEEFERRLRDRGTESEAVIQRRLETARRELEFVDHYQYRVINDQLEQVVNEIKDILSNKAEELISHA